jgi:4-hydroxybenzoate polyprenyltransferase
MQKIMDTIILFIRSMRIQQWVKNVFIFAPMVFSLHMARLDFIKIKNNLLAFFLFGLVAACIYVFNDCFDKKKDRLHPDKKKRPIASGDLSTGTAAVGAGAILLFSLAAIFVFNLYFFYLALVYIGMNLVYSFLLKKIVILDVMVIAVGFVLRVEIGGVINDIELSRWILIITFLLAIFLGLIKRRQEFIQMNAAVSSSNTGIQTRKTLNKYNLVLLDQLISITTATTLISYIIYIVDPDIQQKFHTKYLYLTVPFVVFGIFRYLYLTYVKGKGENAAEIIFSDIPFTANAAIWVAVFILLII